MKKLRNINASSPQTRTKLNMLKPPGYNMNINEMLVLASQKINPIIEMIVDTPNSTEHFVTNSECDDIEEVSNVIGDVAAALANTDFPIEVRTENLNMEKYRHSTNHQGYIYVDTPMLLHILEMYNNLEMIKDSVEAFYRSIGQNSFAQTDSGLISSPTIDSPNSNQIIYKLKRSPTNISCFGLLPNDFIVMPSNNQIVLPLSESKSQTSQRNTANEQRSSARRTRSASSIENEETFEVTDVYGAKKVIVKCIYDLEKVSNYLGVQRKEAFTIYSRAETDSAPGSYRRKSNFSDNSAKNQVRIDNKESFYKNDNNQHKCCCPECFADTTESGNNRQECTEGEVIICIKGCNEDEGDVQIVIRQCPDCKKAAELSTSPDKTTSRASSDRTASLRSPIPDASKPTLQSLKRENLSSLESGFVKPEIYDNKYENYAENTAMEIESKVFHNKDSKGSVVCSEEEDEDEEKRNASSKPEPTYVQNQASVSCSRIKLFETTNLCLKTETGEELVISLTVAPKSLAGPPRKLSITDIFSDTDYAQSPLDFDNSVRTDTKEPSYSDSDRKSQPTKSNNDCYQSSSHRSRSRRSTPNYFVSDRYIPLCRTKVCSSLDFDVTTEQPKINEKGIKNKNNKIVVQLKQFGTDNLLRACRPAKCCRKAILNEKLMKCLPYAPSLRSLPLDDEDMDVINQSLQMSLQKVKNSTNLNKDFYANNLYSMEPIHTVMYFFVEEEQLNKKYLIKQKLSYYINLVKDADYKTISTYETLYFDVENQLHHNQSINSPPTAGTLQKSIDRNIVDVKIADVLSNPVNWLRKKYRNYEERPMMITGHHNLITKNDSFLTKPVRNSCSKPPRTCLSPELKDNGTQKKTAISRIPVYLGLKSLGLNSNKGCVDDNIDVKGCDMSINSFSQQQEVTEQLLIDLPLENFPSENESKAKTNTNHKYTGSSTDEYIKLSRRYSLASTVKRNKRKKKEFYLSRSRSEISLNALNHLIKTKKISTSADKPLNNKADTQTRCKQISQNTSHSNCLLSDQNPSAIILDYFTKVLFEMVMQKMLRDNLYKKIEKNTSRRMSISVGTESTSLQEIFRKQSNNRSDFVSNDNLNFGIPYYGLNNKQSQYCIVQANKGKIRNLCLFNNLALQTSTIFGDDKKCQTSNTFLAYIWNARMQADTSNIKKKRLFKKSYFSEDMTAYSCDEIENFIVTFKSNETVSCNISDKDFTSLYSCNNHPLSESDQDDSLSRSLVKLKETLEKYENIKKEICQEVNVNPIEYFVYQVCACNSKSTKKPSAMQKILSKTRGLFSSVEKDVCRKYQNQRSSFNMSQKEREDLCHNCGCFISKCGDRGSPNRSTTFPLLCKCSQAQKNAIDPRCRQPKPSRYVIKNLSKIASVSVASLKSVKTYINRSLSNMLKNNKSHNLGPCKCDKKSRGSKNVGTICIPKNMGVIRCDKISTWTSTTNDSSTQKCECNKCQTYGDDGTCCCSHCLGSLDKSFDAKLDNHSIETEARLSETFLNVSLKKDKTNYPEITYKASTLPNPVTEESSKLNSGLSDGNEVLITPTNADAILISINNDRSTFNSDDTKGNEHVDIERIKTSGSNNGNSSNEATAFFFMAQPSHLCRSFGLNTGNPFQPRTLNLFRVDNVDSNFDE